MGTWVRIIIGTIATLLGLLWMGQGLNLVGGSTMTGDMKWFYIGGVVVIIGLILTVGGLRKRKPPTS